MGSNIWLSKVAQVILRVADLKRSMAFFGETLGLPLKFNFENFAFYAAGGIDLVLNESKSAKEFGAGLTEITFECEDIQTTHAGLRTRGVAFAREPRVVTGDQTHDLYAVDFRDPDGHVLSLTGRVARA